MKTMTTAQWNLYKELELISPDVEMPNSSGNRLRRIWEYCLTLLFRASPKNYEPQVWQSLDASGNTWWYAYNPIDGNTMCLSSEEEVMIWLDEFHSFRSL